MPQFLSNKDLSLPRDSVTVIGEKKKKSWEMQTEAHVLSTLPRAAGLSIRVLINLYQRRLHRSPIH